MSIKRAEAIIRGMPAPTHFQEMSLWFVFALTYLGIAMGRFPRLVLDRTGIAILGAIAMLLIYGIAVQ